MTRSIVIILIFAAACSTVNADVIRLRSGGEVRGEFSKSVGQDSGDLTTIETLDGIRVVVAQEELVFSKERSRPVEEYYTRLHGIDDSVDARWQLAEWCRSHQLYQQRSELLEQVLSIEPDHAEARRILGYQNYSGKWMTRAEFMESQGYVEFKGKWMTPQERDLREKSDAQRQAEGAWFPKIRLWVGWLSGSDLHRQQAAMAEFQHLTDPDAVTALRHTMETHRDAHIRALYVDVLRQLPNHAGVPALVNRYLLDGDVGVRTGARHALTPEHYAVATPLLLKGLAATDNGVVRRSAQMLGEIGDPKAVPYLIQALVTTHTYQSQIPVNQGVSFGQTASGGTVLNPNQNVLPPDIALMARTGQLPYGVNVQQQGFQRYRTVNVRVDMTNVEVLEALKKITGKDLGFRERDWQLWWDLQKV